MSPRLNDTAPNFTAKTTQGQINFHEWIGDKWAILFSHPKDFTPVCTTELGYMAKIGPDKKIKLMLTYPMTTGRNFDEILRVLDSMQLTAKYKVATPVNWKNGEDVIIAGSVSDADAKTLFPGGWKSPKPYLRVVKQPG